MRRQSVSEKPQWGFHQVALAFSCCSLGTFSLLSASGNLILSNLFLYASCACWRCKLLQSFCVKVLRVGFDLEGFEVGSSHYVGLEPFYQF